MWIVQLLSDEETMLWKYMFLDSFLVLEPWCASCLVHIGDRKATNVTNNLRAENKKFPPAATAADPSIVSRC